jgi:hypothetical protein
MNQVRLMLALEALLADVEQAWQAQENEPKPRWQRASDRECRPEVTEIGVDRTAGAGNWGVWAEENAAPLSNFLP